MPETNAEHVNLCSRFTFSVPMNEKILQKQESHSAGDSNKQCPQHRAGEPCPYLELCRSLRNVAAGGKDRTQSPNDFLECSVIFLGALLGLCDPGREGF